MFDAVQALLLTAGLRRNKHSGVFSTFNEHFCKVRHSPSSHFFIPLCDGVQRPSPDEDGFCSLFCLNRVKPEFLWHMNLVRQIDELPATMP